jgi:serine/threonine-protein kinase RsbW
VSPETTERLEVRIPGRLRYLPALRELVREAIADVDERSSDADALLLAIQEACVNAIRHGHGGEGSLPVDVTLTIGSDWIEVLVADRGEGFEIPESGLPEMGTTRENGRGLPIIRATVDEMEVLRRNGATVLRLLKRRSRS